MSSVATPSVAAKLSLLWLEITSKCNLHCSHCYADSGPTHDLYGTMQREDWINLINEASCLGCRDIQFIGGEPTIHPDIKSLIGLARAKGFKSVEVFTNATRMSSDLIDCFQEHEVRVATSFYSDDPDTHEHITGIRGSWHKTVEGIKKVLKFGLSLRVGVIEMDHNVGQLQRTMTFLNSLGVKDVKPDRVRGVGRGLLQQLGKTSSDFNELCGQCWKGRLCVTSSATAYPCVFARSFPMGDARNGLQKILESNKLQEFRRDLQRSRVNQLGHSGVTMLENSCNPYPCNPDDQCRPDCRPNVGCSPDEMSCNPDMNCNPN